MSNFASVTAKEQFMKKFPTLLLALFVLTSGAQPKNAKLIKEHCYADYKLMYKQPEGGALIYPYITPGSRQYARVLWEWGFGQSTVTLGGGLESLLSGVLLI